MPPADIERLADQFMEGLRIREHAKKYSNDCSGGTKRKLSYAMAMLGKPKIVLLDEPSTGMDPKSKRFVWDTILASFRVRTEKTCFVALAIGSSRRTNFKSGNLSCS